MTFVFQLYNLHRSRKIMVLERDYGWLEERSCRVVENDFGYLILSSECLIRGW